MSSTDHNQQDEEEGTLGMALGFRIVEDGDQLFLAEAEISPYVDQPEELGVTLVFHPLEGINPVEASEEMDWPAWPIDIDDDLTRDGSQPIAAQFQAIVRQLHQLPASQLQKYLDDARDADAAGEAEDE
ncbi:hypothetical protein BH23GEM6_BH23GEM6_14700 [soil metagenome]